MTDVAGPFDGTPWAEAQWARHAAQWAPSGVYGSPAASTTTGDLPLSVSALTVGLGAGRAWVRGFGFERTGAAVMQAVSANTHASFNRRDRIVLRRNLATHTLTPVLLTGTPAGTPAAPALTQSETGSWDLPMFSFLVPPASGTSITGIVDERAWVSPNGAGLDASTPVITEATTVGGDLTAGPRGIHPAITIARPFPFALKVTAFVSMVIQAGSRATLGALGDPNGTARRGRQENSGATAEQRSISSMDVMSSTLDAVTGLYTATFQPVLRAEVGTVTATSPTAQDSYSIAEITPR